VGQTTIDQSYFSSGLSTYQWNIAGSPYEIMSDIEIMDGSNLIIEPGVQVLFHGHFKIDVRGAINAIGTNKNRIIFTSDIENPWNGIRFDFSDGHTVITTSKFHYCDISNAQKTGTVCSSPDPESSGGAIYARSFSALEIIDCEIINNSVQAHGGAIGLFEGSSPLIRNNSIHNNFALQRGGGIAMWRSCNPDIYDNNISKNEAKKGGGAMAMLVFKSTNYPCNPNVHGNIISDNIVSGNSGAEEGGGVFICGSNPTFTNNSFTGNSCANIGGAISVQQNSNVVFENNAFMDNQSITDGGGIYSTSSNITLLSCQFTNNNTDANGGGICIYGSVSIIQNCTFSENTASLDGGGIYIYESVSTIEKCILENNTATGNGGGVFMYDPAYDNAHFINTSMNLNSFKYNTAFQGSALYLFRQSNPQLYTNYQKNAYILNNLFAENLATDMGTVYFQGNNNNTVFNHNTVTHNSAVNYFWIPGVCVDFEANFPDVNSPNKNFHNNIIYEFWADIVIVFDVNNNLLLQNPFNYSILAGLNYLNRDNNNPSNPNPSPGFISSTDYHLTSSSPCIDSGTNLIYPYITTLDLDGTQRIVNGTTDFGCYEY
jgi:predicted outer membrane repeat protein